MTYPDSDNLTAIDVIRCVYLARAAEATRRRGQCSALARQGRCLAASVAAAYCCSPT